MKITFSFSLMASHADRKTPTIFTTILTTIRYWFYEKMSHKAPASFDPDLHPFHQAQAHAVEITQKPEWEMGNSFPMRHPG